MMSTELPPFLNPRPPKRTLHYTPPESYKVYWGRFYNRVGLPGGDPMDDEAYFDRCWPWLGRPRATGQLFFHVSGVPTQVHRFAWILRIGAMPDTHVARPVCGSPTCVNHTHLIRRPRHGRGNPLDDRARADIRELFLTTTGTFTARELAKIFAVSERRIYQIVEGLDRGAKAPS